MDYHGDRVCDRRVLAHGCGILYRYGNLHGRGLLGADDDLSSDLFIQLVCAQTGHGDRDRCIGNRFGNTHRRALYAVADRRTNLLEKMPKVLYAILLTEADWLPNDHLSKS